MGGAGSPSGGCRPAATRAVRSVVAHENDTGHRTSIGMLTPDDASPLPGAQKDLHGTEQVRI
jgi:hypothetical protein